jgi:hypothetical protein
MTPQEVVEPEMPLPPECRLAPVEPELRQESFYVLGSLATEDFSPPEDEQWEWAGVAEPDWPYPSRAIWPSLVELPLTPDDYFEFVALGGASVDDLYVVGQRAGAALILHWVEGSWIDESAAALAALPSASVANSVSVATPDQVWVTTPEGLLRSNGTSKWTVVDVPDAISPLGAIWINEQGFGVVAGGSVATTQDAGNTWKLETRTLGFVAPGLAYSRSFVRVAGRDQDVAVVGRYGHLITRGESGWTAATVFGSDVAFTKAGQFMTTRNPAQGLFFQNAPDTWNIYPLTLSGGLDRVWASTEGEVFAGGTLNAILHRFVDGTLELLPSEVADVRDFYGQPPLVYSLGSTSLWRYDLGDVRTSGVSQAAVVNESLLNIEPSPRAAWGQSAASNFEALDCVDDEVFVGAPAWQGELAPGTAKARYGSCYGVERQYSETAFSFTAPSAGTYRMVLEEAISRQDDGGTLQLALRNGCEGWLIWNGGFVGNRPAVDIGLEEGQVVLVEVWASRELESPVAFELSIH